MKLSDQYRVFDVAGQSLMIYTGSSTVDTNAALALSDSAAWLVSKIGDRDFTEDLLVEWLLEEYDVDRDKAASDVKNLLAVFREHHIVLE